MAGRILQKFTNYYIKAAAIIPKEKVKSGRFREMALEANSGNQFKVFENREEAEKWLLTKIVSKV